MVDIKPPIEIIHMNRLAESTGNTLPTVPVSDLLTNFLVPTDAVYWVGFVTASPPWRKPGFF